MGRHMILSLGRSGSNTLADLLNQHPQILNVGEVLGPWTKTRAARDRFGFYAGDDQAYLDALTRKSPLICAMLACRNLLRLLRGDIADLKRLRPVRTVGVKDFATLLDEAGLSDWLLAQSDLKVVGLVRDDLVERLVSWKRLDQTGVVANRSGTKMAASELLIDPAQIVRLFTAIDQEHALLMRLLQGLPGERLRILSYDQFFSDPETRGRQIAEIYEFLGVDPFEPEIRMSKIVHGPAAAQIANRADCAAALVGSRYEGLLDLPS